MPCRNWEVDLNVLTRSDGKIEDSSFPIQAVGLILGLQHQSAYERCPCGFSQVQASSVDLEDTKRNLESRWNVLLVDGMIATQIRVCCLNEPFPRTDVVGQSNPN